MKKTFLQKTIWFLLFGFGVCAFLSEPADDSKTWLTDVLVSKALGAAAIFAAWKLDAIITTIKSA